MLGKDSISLKGIIHFCIQSIQTAKKLTSVAFPFSFSQAGYLYLTDGLRLHELMIHLGIDSTEA